MAKKTKKKRGKKKVLDVNQLAHSVVAKATAQPIPISGPQKNPAAVALGTWKFRGRSGITLGDPTKYFPYPVGPRYQIDTTEDADPELDEEEVRAIERRFTCVLITSN